MVGYLFIYLFIHKYELVEEENNIFFYPKRLTVSALHHLDTTAKREYEIMSLGSSGWEYMTCHNTRYRLKTHVQKKDVSLCNIQQYWQLIWIQPDGRWEFRSDLDRWLNIMEAPGGLFTARGQAEASLSGMDPNPLELLHFYRNGKVSLCKMNT